MIISAFKFARVRIIATCYSLTFLGAAYAGHVTLKTVMAILPLIAITIHANSINDYADLEIDKINMKDSKDRPLVSGDISIKEFWAIHFISGVIALLSSIFYGSYIVVLTLLILAIDYLYSLEPFRLSRRPLMSPLILSLAYVFYSTYLGYYSIITQNKLSTYLLVGLIAGFFARLLLKDYRDIIGDKKFGRKTFLIKYGSFTTCLLSGVLWVCATLLVAKSTNFNFSLVIPFIFLVAFTLIMLKELSKTDVPKRQNILIYFIANNANISIIMILSFLLCQQSSESVAIKTLLPAALGIGLILFNWLDYSKHRPSSLAELN